MRPEDGPMELPKGGRWSRVRAWVFVFGTGGLVTFMANAVFTRGQTRRECLLMLLCLGSRRSVNDMSGSAPSINF